MRLNNKLKEIIAYLLGLALIALLLRLAGLIQADRLVFPGTGEILAAFFRLILSARTWEMIGGTLMRLILALAISVLGGTALGLLTGLNSFLRHLLRPLSAMLRSIPMLVLIIVVMVLSRYQYVPVIASVLVLTPMIQEAACEGCMRISTELIDVWRMNSGLNLTVITHVYLPLMSGYLRQSFLNAAAMGIKLVISGEYMVQARSSLGKAIYNSSYFNEYPDIYAYALIMILMVLFLSSLPAALFRLISMRSAQKGLRVHRNAHPKAR